MVGMGRDAMHIAISNHNRSATKSALFGRDLVSIVIMDNLGSHKGPAVRQAIREPPTLDAHAIILSPIPAMAGQVVNFSWSLDRSCG